MFLLSAVPPLHFRLMSICSIIFALTLIADGQTGKLRKQAEKAMRAGEFAAAEQHWREIVRNEPENNTYQLKLSHALFKQRKIQESFDTAFAVVKKDKFNARARALVGANYLAAGNFDEAKSFLNDALFIDGDEPLALASAALIDYYENRSKSALERLRRAVYVAPDEPDFLFARAQIAARSESYKEAAEAYTKFLKIAPVNDSDRRDRIQGLIDFLNYLGSQKTLYAVSGKRRTEVSCEIVNNRPIINVRLNGGEETLRFVLDTGSGMTVISDETAARFGLKHLIRGGMARAIGGGGKFPIVYGFVEHLDIGDVRVSQIPVFIRKFNQNGDKFDGYLGISLLSKFLTTLDYRNKTFGLVKSKSKENEVEPTIKIADAERLKVPLRLTSSGFLSSPVEIEGVKIPLNFIIDTGASVSVISQEAAKNEAINRHTQTGVMRVFGAAGVAENVQTVLLPRLTLGKYSREQITAAVLDLEPINETAGFEQAGILGGNFLQHYRLTFDFQRGHVFFEPQDKTVNVNFSEQK